MKNFKLVLSYIIKWISIAPILTGLFLAGFQIGDSFDYESFVFGWGLVALGAGLFLFGKSWAKSQSGVFVSNSRRLLIVTLFIISGLIFIVSWWHQKTSWDYTPSGDRFFRHW